MRVIGVIFLDFPAAVGVRYPWSPGWWSWLSGIPMLVIALVALVIGVRRAAGQTGAERFLIVGFVLFSGLVMLSSSGVDSSGRYFLPAVVMLMLILAFSTEFLSVCPGGQRVAPMITGIFLTLQLIGNISAMRTVPPGLTSQFDPATDFTSAYDQQAIDFLETHHGDPGYSTYWVTFRLAFLSHEQVILDVWLPNKSSLLYRPVARRYPPYTQLVGTAGNPVYVTANTPELNTELRQSFAKLNIHYSEQTIGPYLIFYDLSQKITSDQLGLGLPGVSP